MKQKTFKKTAIGEIPEGWGEFSLQDLIDIKHGFAFKGEYFTDEPEEDILLTPGNFNIGGGFKANKLKYYRGEYPKEYILGPGDIIITMTDLSKNGDTLGYPARVPAINGMRYLHNQRLGLVNIKSNQIDKDFLYWLLRTRDYQRFIVNSASGSTVKHTSPTRIQEYTFVAPSPIQEQRAIAKILSDLDAKIELNRQMNKTLESIAQAIFKRWFVDFKFPDEKGKPYKSSGGKMINSELGEIPEKWGVGKINELVQVLSGFAFKSSDFVDSGQYRLVTIKNVQDGYFEGETKDGLNALPDKMPEYCKLQNGDILLSLTGNVGRVCLIAGENYILNQRVAKLSSVNKINYGFVYLLFRQNEILTMLGNLSSGTAQQNLSPIKTAEINIIIPDRVIMEQFGKIVNPMFKMILDNLNQNIFLSQIRDSLLPRLMSGKIRAIIKKV